MHRETHKPKHPRTQWHARVDPSTLVIKDEKRPATYWTSQTYRTPQTILTSARAHPSTLTKDEKRPATHRTPQTMSLASYPRVDPSTLTKDEKRPATYRTTQAMSRASYARVDPSTLTKDEKHPATYRTPRTIFLAPPKQVVEREDRSTSPFMLPSLLDMIIDDLKLTEPLTPDLVKTLERDGETMVHEYYAAKANKVIEHNRKNRAFDQGKKSLPLDGNLDMSWARDIIDKKLAKAESLVQSRMMQKDAENRQQQEAPAANHMHSRTTHQYKPTQYPHTTPSLHTGLPGQVERHTLTTLADAKSYTQTVQSKDERRPLRRATVETVTDSSSDHSGWKTGQGRVRQASPRFSA